MFIQLQRSVCVVVKLRAFHVGLKEQFDTPSCQVAAMFCEIKVLHVCKYFQSIPARLQSLLGVRGW
jgi:hypothetical protein